MLKWNDESNGNVYYSLCKVITNNKANINSLYSLIQIFFQVSSVQCGRELPMKVVERIGLKDLAYDFYLYSSNVNAKNNFKKAKGDINAIWEILHPEEAENILLKEK